MLRMGKHFGTSDVCVADLCLPSVPARGTECLPVSGISAKHASTIRARLENQTFIEKAAKNKIVSGCWLQDHGTRVLNAMCTSRPYKINEIVLPGNMNSNSLFSYDSSWSHGTLNCSGFTSIYVNLRQD